MATQSTAGRRTAGADDDAVRRRILDAAFRAFMDGGYTETSTLEIATRAHVSKRALYALVGTKQEMLVACISERARRLQAPADLPEPHDRETLSRALVTFGTQLLREVSDPTVIAVFRLAIAEAVRSPEVARALDSIGVKTSRSALREIMTRACSSRLLDGDAAALAEHFSGLLWGNLMMGLLLRLVDRPKPDEIARRARDATAAFLQLHPQPGDAWTA
jgi:AcrR family transcriptional regulator